MDRLRPDVGPVLFRCDGTADLGLGHVSRSAALAEALTELGIPCVFRGRFEAGAAELLAGVRARVQPSTARVGAGDDLRDTVGAARELGAAAVVLDSYAADAAYVGTLNREAAPVVVIDDFAALARYECAVVLNFTVAAPQVEYPAGSAVRLLGLEYFLARQVLRRQRGLARPRSGDVERVLVAIGGVDGHNLSGLATAALLKVSSALIVHVVVGSSYAHVADLEARVSSFAAGSRVIAQLPDLAAELNWADVCVSGGGLTKYEAAYLGVPAAVLSQNAEQARETEAFAERGLAVTVGSWARADVAAVADRLSRLHADRRARESLSRSGLAAFPADPTRHAAEAVAAALGLRG